ncbi:MAG: MATE family efflux transporter [Lentisphaeria bacterium]|nr:MATE family efflux transporter [Lentisphaeria bacterium]
MATRKHLIDMTSGPLLGNILRYAVPLGLTNILQIAFHAADMIVIGRFASHRSMAAIGSVGEISWLLICLVIGISTGSNVVVAQMFGAKDQHGVRRVVHTSLAFALVSGFVLMIVGQSLLRPVLHWINVPPDIFELSLRYLRICFCGLPLGMLTNFSISILRGIGDSRRPLWFLSLGGLVNLLLNILLVAGFGLDVGGVAIATVASQTLTMTLCLRALIVERSSARLFPRGIRFYPEEVKRILRIGIPAGLQSACYASANFIIQAAINTLGTAAIAGNTAACVLEMALHTWVAAIYQTVMAFVGQNYGAQEYRRAVRSIVICLWLGGITITVMAWLTVWNGEALLRLINRNPEVVGYGMERVRVNFTVYFLLAAMDITSGGLRGMGRSVTPLVVTLLGACVLRVTGVYTVVRAGPTRSARIAAMPVSGVGVGLVNGAILHVLCRRRTETRKLRRQ